MRTRTLLALACTFLASAVLAAETPRFSQSLTAEQRALAGLAALDSDQIAALDALVRLGRNQAAAEARRTENALEASPVAATGPAPATTAFTAGLSVDQRRAAGIDTLSTEQQASLDTFVAEQFTAPVLARPTTAPTTAEAVEFFPDRWEIHGEFGLSIGGGSGGYHSRAAWMTTSLLDTKTGTEFSVGVATGKEKWNGRYPYRYGYDYDWDEVSFGLSAPLFGRR